MNYAPFSGYDLKKAFDTSVQHFWPADQSQIYRTLSRLEEEGWAEMEVVHQESRPDRKVYHITEAGREELRRWLTTPLPLEDVREPFLIQVFFAGLLGEEEIVDLFRQKARGLRERLDRYRQVPQESEAYAGEIESPREVFFWMLTLECGFVSTEAELAWVESAIRRIEKRDFSLDWEIRSNEGEQGADFGSQR